MLFSKPKYEYIIVGLGNPGDKYANTRHNAGFRCLDLLIKEFNAGPEKSKFQSLIYDAEIKGHKVLFQKPQTFMNNSGAAVNEVARFYKIPSYKIIVVADDVTIDAGRLRIRKSGSHGGHNGLRDIIGLLGTDNIPRVKIGMGQKPHPEYDLADWVLSTPSKEDKEKTDDAEKRAAEAVKTMVTSDIGVAMNKFNR
ncbi:MAG: aminoacyl-tRNA hydrolase [Clostridia bacterium]|nr:aminoacyl-tRNA hydrolase [Clostridia bacterium]